MLDALLFCAGLSGTFLLWTLVVYWLHRLGHWKARWNPLFRIHRFHHQIRYPGSRKLPKWSALLFWQGSWQCTVDVLITMTLPLLALAWLLPQYALWLIPFHYFYETFLSENVLDHNLAVKGPITRVFAWGEYHMAHHARPRRNYGLMIVLWDYVFATCIKPQQRV